MARGVQYEVRLILNRIDGKLAGLRQEREMTAARLAAAKQRRIDSVDESLEAFDSQQRALEQTIENATDHDTAAWAKVREAANDVAATAAHLAAQDQPTRDELVYQGMIDVHDTKIADLESKRELVASVGVDKISSYELERLRLLPVLQ
jgi:vacuolar-type H+-ATPase subunit I/STV1